DQEVEGDRREGPTRPDPLEGRRGGPELARSPHRRGIRMPNPDGRGHPPATRRERLSRGARPQAARGPAGREAARWRAGSEDHSRAARSPARRVFQLNVAATGSESRGAGDRRVRQLRDGAAGSEKSGMTNRKIEYWVIPPEADGEFVAH